MSEMTTYSKKEFDPIAPNLEDIDIVDIAHALTMLCRAGGHFPHFYSVAQHCINCANEAKARGYSQRAQLGCLLHDASEAYLADITRPVKSHLSGYHEIEDKLQGMIFDKWISPKLTEEERKQIFEIDDAILYFEFIALMQKKIFPEEPPLRSLPRFDLRDFDSVEAEFLNLFDKLTADAPHVGADWLQGKWIAAELRGKTASYRIFDSISALCAAYEQNPHVLIDVPIGLPESPEEAILRPDKAAREYLKIAARKSSVFPVPFRQLIYEDNKQKMWEMSKKLGAKTTSVGTGIFPCIRQVDTFLLENPSWQKRLIESHPECAFQALGDGNGVTHSKHNDKGIAERVAILSPYVSNIEHLVASIPKAQREDLLDALALAVTASLPFESVQSDIFRDRKGLPMRIVIAK